MSLWIDDLAAFDALYGQPGETSTAKEVDHLHPLYRPFIERSPFVLLATSGPGGLDVSPRGDPPGFVHILDEKTLVLPDRRGNNRADSLRNVLVDPRVALIFLVPGCRETLRVNGRARISVDPALLARWEQPSRSVLVISIETVFFQCARALIRSSLWDPSRHVPREELPKLGEILETFSCGRIDGAAYDAELPERQKKTLY